MLKELLTLLFSRRFIPLRVFFSISLTVNVDVTHRISDNDFHLLIVMAINHANAGRPIMYSLITSETLSAYRMCVTAMLQTFGDMSRVRSHLNRPLTKVSPRHSKCIDMFSPTVTASEINGQPFLSPCLKISVQILLQKLITKFTSTRWTDIKFDKCYAKLYTC